MEQHGDDLNGSEKQVDFPSDGKYEQFAMVNDSIVEELRSLINQIEVSGKGCYISSV